jgi:hypothetical protein
MSRAKASGRFGTVETIRPRFRARPGGACSCSARAPTDRRCFTLPKHFPYRKRFISASSTAMRLSRSARAASTSATSKRCGMCCEQFAACYQLGVVFDYLGFAPNLDTPPVCIVHPGLLSTRRFSIAIATDQQISKTDRTQTADTLRSLDAFS